MFLACPLEYYRTMFRDGKSLARLYPQLAHHGLTAFLSPDLMRFPVRNSPASNTLPARFKAEVTSDMNIRPEGVRINHRRGGNSVRMYDRQGSAPRVINDTADFKTFRTPEDKPRESMRRHRMPKGIADLNRRADVSQTANNRYLQAPASVDDTTVLGGLTTKLCQPVKRDGRRARPFNPLAPGGARLNETIGRVGFVVNGFRNRGRRPLLFAEDNAPEEEQRRNAAAVSRKLALPRAYGPINQGTEYPSLPLVRERADFEEFPAESCPPRLPHPADCLTPAARSHGNDARTVPPGSVEIRLKIRGIPVDSLPSKSEPPDRMIKFR